MVRVDGLDRLAVEAVAVRRLTMRQLRQQKN